MDGRGAEPAPAVANFKSEQMNVALSAQAMTAAAAPSQGCFRLFSLIVETLLVILGQGGGRKEGGKVARMEGEHGNHGFDNEVNDGGVELIGRCALVHSCPRRYKRARAKPFPMRT